MSSMTHIRRTESLLRAWLATGGVHILRIAVGVIFIWFGALKLVPGLSPAEGLVAASVSWAVDPSWFIPLLATWEVAIGVGLVIDRLRRLTLLLLFAHMGGTFMPLVVCPELVWVRFPFGLTLEGQYIVKNFVLIAAGLVFLGRSVFERRQASASVGQGVDPFSAHVVAESGELPAGLRAYTTQSISSCPWERNRPRTTIYRR